MKPPLTAAVKRLTAYAKWDGDSPNPYNDSGHSMSDDLRLALSALSMVDDLGTHVDDRDAEPVFEVRPECLWTNARKGLLHCLGAALVNETAKDGDTFQ